MESNDNEILQQEQPEEARADKKKQLLLKVVVPGVAILAVLAVLVYIITTPPNEITASKQYVEDHYDVLAERAVEIVFRENSLKTELIAEVAESVAEQVVPYDCDATGRCNISFTTTQPFKIDIDAPAQIELEPVRGPFGQKGFRGVNGEFIRNEMAINSASLESIQEVREEISEAAEEAKQEIEQLEDAGNQMLDKVIGR